MNPTQTPTEPGLEQPLERPNEAGPWFRYGVAWWWDYGNSFGRMILWGHKVGDNNPGTPIDEAPRGGWLAATPAPAPEAVAGKLRQVCDLLLESATMADKARALLLLVSPPAPAGQHVSPAATAAINEPCGKSGCGKPAKHRVNGSMTYYACDDHLKEIERLCESEDRVTPAAPAEQVDESEAIKWLGNVIEKLAALKDEAVANQNFERACALRDAYAILRDEAKVQPSAPAQEEGQSERQQQLEFPRSYYEQRAGKQQQTINELREQLAAAENERDAVQADRDQALMQLPQEFRQHTTGLRESVKRLIDYWDAQAATIKKLIRQRDEAFAELRVGLESMSSLAEFIQTEGIEPEVAQHDGKKYTATLAIEIIRNLRRIVGCQSRDIDNARRILKSEWWSWQGDGSDHLHTLTCPVMIQPKDLLDLLDGARQTVEEKGEQS